MTKQKTRVARSFYEKRDLPSPAAEWWPENSAELAELLVSKQEMELGPMLLLGDGQHVRHGSKPGASWQVIRTEECNALLDLDERSGLVRVEAGMRWKDLRALVEDRGFSLDRYALQPASATIGGLLARNRIAPKQLWSGDIRDGCVAIQSISPMATDRVPYGYLPAPRKASGPDLRYLHIGGEGQFGAILDATLVVWPSLSGRLYKLQAPLAGAAIRAWKKLSDLGVRVSWSYWQRSQGALTIGVHGPAPLLSRLDKLIENAWEDGVTIEGYDEERRRRGYLEDRYSGRRASTAAAKTIEVLWRLDQLKARLGEVNTWAADIELVDWTSHTVTGHVVLEDEHDPEQIIERIYPNTLGAVPIIENAREPINAWTRGLRQALDPKDVLAVNH